MNAIELALARQRLQHEAGIQRAALAAHAAGMQPLFEAADGLQAGARWVRRHPEVVAGSVAVLVATSRGTRHFLWRWAKRSLVAWKLWRESERWLVASGHLR
ncbi:MAG: YqjK family protein [Rhodocyclaceae bacterium]|jgi:hypothetical protein|nr:YqjK family protein [Rhodocyclaceae bacterium]